MGRCGGGKRRGIIYLDDLNTTKRRLWRIGRLTGCFSAKDIYIRVINKKLFGYLLWIFHLVSVVAISIELVQIPIQFAL